MSMCTQVTYNIAYTGIDGITTASVTFTFADIALSDLPFTQTFTVNYYQVSQPRPTPMAQR